MKKSLPDDAEKAPNTVNPTHNLIQACQTGADKSLEFLLSTHQALFPDVKIDFNEEIDGASLIQHVLHTHFPASQKILEILIKNGAIVKPEYLLLANNNQIFDFLHHYCKPNFETIIRAIKLNSNFILRLMQLNIPLDMSLIIWDPKNHTGDTSNKIEAKELFSFFSTNFPRRPVTYDFYFLSIKLGFFSSFPNVKKTQNYILENFNHRELILYNRLLNSIVLFEGKIETPEDLEKANISDTNRRLKNLVYISGKSHFNIPGSQYNVDLSPEKSFTRHTLLRGFLCDGLLNPFPARILAHVFLIQLTDSNVKKEEFLNAAQKFGQEKIYYALQERLNIIDDNTIKLAWLARVRDSGIFENKKPFLGEGNLYKKITEQIDVLSPPKVENPQSTSFYGLWKEHQKKYVDKKPTPESPMKFEL